MNYRHLLLPFALFVIGSTTRATHLRAGELRYEHMEGLTYRVQGILYLDPNSPADRPEIVIYIDGVADTVPRTEIIDFPSATSCGAIRRCVYETQHSFPGPGLYTIDMVDSNRNSGIVNVPNSVSQSFCVKAIIVIGANGPNNSVRFAAPALFSDMEWSTLVHDPIAEEDDGDSLSFDLVTPHGLGCIPIAGYALPYSPSPGWAWLDPTSGVYAWYMPNLIGEYTIAIRASEWRNNAMIGQVTRDMAFCVSALPTAVPTGSAATEDVHLLRVNDEWMLENNTPGVLIGELIDARGAMIRTLNLTSGRTLVPLSDQKSLVLLRTTDTAGRKRTFKLTP